MRSQIVTGAKRNIRFLPHAFTEHGAVMAASVLNSPRAIEVSVYVVRAFVRLQELAGANRDVMVKLEQLERRITGHDKAIAGLFDAIRHMLQPEEKERKGIGFRVEEEGAAYVGRFSAGFGTKKGVSDAWLGPTLATPPENLFTTRSLRSLETRSTQSLQGARKRRPPPSVPGGTPLIPMPPSQPAAAIPEQEMLPAGSPFSFLTFFSAK